LMIFQRRLRRRHSRMWDCIAKSNEGVRRSWEKGGRGLRVPPSPTPDFYLRARKLSVHGGRNMAITRRNMTCNIYCSFARVHMRPLHLILFLISTTSMIRPDARDAWNTPNESDQAGLGLPVPNRPGVVRA
jgi:hypothetical protein